MFRTVTGKEVIFMNRKEQARFDKLYQLHLTELKLQGLAPKTIYAYSRAVRRIADYFGRCPDRLTQAQLKSSLPLWSILIHGARSN